MSNHNNELTQGNMSQVYLENNIIHRKMKPYSITVHRLLQHLELKEINFVPKLIGVNKFNNEEMLTFVEGEAKHKYPITSDIDSRIETVFEAGKLLRKYHEATVDFIDREDDSWFLEYKGDLNNEVICHNDFAPYNITFKGNIPIGIIDFDTACPAPKIWDVAYAVYRFLPLSEEFYKCYSKEKNSLEIQRLLGMFIKGYGSYTNKDVLDILILRLQSLVELFDEKYKEGDRAFIRMMKEGHQQFYINEINFIKVNMKDWF